MNKVTPLWRWIALSIAATFLLPFGQAFANYSMMDDPGCPGRVSNGLILLYNFSENNDVTVNDISGYGTPLTAHIENPSKITWMQPCGVNITGSKIISNSGANKVSSRIKQTNSITVETWVKTSNAWQYGPARVITISENTSLRNFTLGQQDDDWVIRYKTNNTDDNGTPESKAVNKVKTEWQHVVYTRASNGKERIFIDGVKVYEGYRYGNSSNWGEHCKLAIGDEMSNDRQWKGMVNLVAVYDRALTPTEITQNYTFGSCCSASNGEVSIECQNDINVTAAVGQSTKVVTFNAPTATTTCEIISQPDCSQVSENHNGFIYIGKFGDSKYFCANGDNFTYADALAGAASIGGHLVTINSQAENDFVASKVMADFAWIGLNDIDTEGTFKWVTGEDATWTYWSSNEPNDQDPNGYGADGVVLERAWGKWLDRDVNGKYEYVVEIPCPGGNRPGTVTVEQTAGPTSGSAFPVGMTTVEFTATDECGNTASCTFKVTVDPSPCEIDAVSSDVLCNDNGTPQNPADDTYTFKLKVTSNGSCSTGWSGGGKSGSYGQTKTYGPFAISGGSKTVTVCDNAAGTICKTVTVNAPAPCSFFDPCILSANADNILCNDNGTPSNPADDTYTFDVYVFRTGGCSTSSWSGGGKTGDFNTATSFGPFPIGTNQSFQITTTDGGSTTLNVTSPTACSFADPCTLSTEVTNKICNDNGTPFVVGDDFYTFELTVFRTGGCSSTPWSGGGKTGGYNTPVLFGPYPIGFHQSFSISNGEAAAVVEVQSPDACSQFQQPCSVNLVVSNKNCNDNGTPADPADDTYTFDITVNGSNTSGNWNANFDNAFLGAYAIGDTPYGTTVNLGPFPIGYDINVYVNDSGDLNCKDSEVVGSPQPCSNAGGGNKIGDFVWNDINGNGLQEANEPGLSGVWIILEDCNGNFKNVTFTDVNGMYMFSDITPGDYKIRFANPGGFVFTAQNNAPDAADSDVDVYGYTDCFTVTANTINNDIDAGFTTFQPQNCVITGTTANVVCDDNGTPNDPSDDTFTFEVSATAVNDGAWGWAIPALNLTYLPYGQPVVVGPYPISGGNVTLTLRDQDKQDCLTTVTVIAPQPCSTTPVCDNVTNGGQIGGAQTNCGGFDPAPLTSVSLPTGGSGAIEYMWLSSTSGCPTSTNQAIPGAHDATYDPGYLSQTTWFVRCSRRANCTDWTVGESNCVKITIENCPPVCDNVTNGGQIGGAQTNCGGFDPAPLTSVSLPTGGSGAIEYMWLSSTSGCPTSTNQAIAGAHDATYDPGYLSQTTWFVRCSRRANCTDWTVGESNCVKITIENCPPVCDNVTNGGQIGGAQTNCGGFDPAPITSVSLPTGGSGAIEYMWLSSTTGCPTSTNQAIAGAHAATYDPGYLSQTTWFVRCSRRANCTDWTVGESNCVKIEVKTNCGTLSFNCNNNITATAAVGESGTVVTYNAPTANSTCPTGSVSVVRTAGPASGSVFPIGTTTVTYVASDNCGNSETCSFNVVVTPGTPTGDCTDFPSYSCNGSNQGGWEPWWEWIANVKFAGIDNPSSKDQYRFFADVAPASIAGGQAYDITLTPGLSWGGYQTNLYWRVWIDFNRDGDFDDAGELVVETANSNQVVNATVQVPANAAPGGTRMRIAVQRDQYAGACENFAFGEMEDYKVCITGGNPCQDADNDGVCDSDDCAPNNPNLPTTPGTPCNDGNPTTFNDVIGPDGCSCAGTPDVCTISADVNEVVCSDNGTPADPSDDTYTFKVTVFRTGGCTSSTWNGGGQSGAYNTAVTYGPFAISSGGRTFIITNAEGASSTVTVDAPNTCSSQDPCSITTVVNNVNCDDNGTPTDPSDDTYTFKLKVSKAGYCTSSTWNGGGQSGNYGVYVTYGPFPISGGGKTFVVSNGDGATTTVTVQAPNTCSNQDPCSLDGQVTDILCDDNGTPANADDDTYTFKLTVTKSGYCTSSNWNAGGVSGNYGTATTFGPYPISGGNKVITVTNADGASKTFTATAPAPCSQGPEVCVEREVTNNKLCDNNLLYGLWIDATFTGYGTLDKHFDVVSGTLTEYVDGTARFVGTFANKNNGNVKWDADIHFSGRTENKPSGSPHTSNCYSGNGEGFWYYTNTSGTLTGRGALAGAKANVSRRGPAFQLGVGANLNEADKLGGSGWLTLSLTSQPNSGSISNLGDADFNWNLSGQHYACVPVVNVCVEREVTSNKRCADNILYGLWISADFSGHGTVNNHYEVESGNLKEYEDGTATFTGTFVNRSNTNVKWVASIDLTGRTSTAPAGSPKTSNCYNGNGDGFWYYQTISGTLVGQGAIAGAKANVSRRGPAFQLGVGANLNEGDKFGASGWLTLDLISQPNSGTITNMGDADFNWNLSGQHYACVAPPVVCNRTVLFVVGSTWLGSGDLAVKNRLIELGFDVTLKDDSDCRYGDGAGYGLVLISSTCSSSRVGDKFRDIDVPVVSYEGWIFDDMKMTGGTSLDFGKWGTSKQIKILTSGHPLAAGFEGTIDVCTISQSYHWGKPSNDAIKVAAFTHDNNKLPFFAYEKGKSMVGKNAPARRVGLFFDNYSGPYMNNKGWALFDACILWASECQPMGGSSRIGVTQFDATLDQGVVSLAWVNNTGYKNDKFTVERSLDGVNFEPLLETPTMDDTDNARFYKELDKFPVAGFNYYRLVNHYVDGSFEVSEIRKVKIDDIEQFGLFPNPAADVVNVALKGYEGKNITIQLVDQLGRLVKEETIDNASDTRYEINISNARNGVYTLWIFADESKPVGKKLIIANTY